MFLSVTVYVCPTRHILITVALLGGSDSENCRNQAGRVEQIEGKSVKVEGQERQGRNSGFESRATVPSLAQLSITAVKLLSETKNKLLNLVG